MQADISSNQSRAGVLADVAKFNAETKNQGILGAADALGNAQLQAANALGTATQTNYGILGNALASSAQGWANAFDTVGTEREKTNAAYASADRATQVSTAIANNDRKRMQRMYDVYSKTPGNEEYARQLAVALGIDYKSPLQNSIGNVGKSISRFMGNNRGILGNIRANNPLTNSQTASTAPSSKFDYNNVFDVPSLRYSRNPYAASTVSSSTSKTPVIASNNNSSSVVLENPFEYVYNPNLGNNENPNNEGQFYGYTPTIENQSFVPTNNITLPSYTNRVSGKRAMNNYINNILPAQYIAQTLRNGGPRNKLSFLKNIGYKRTR